LRTFQLFSHDPFGTFASLRCSALKITDLSFPHLKEESRKRRKLQLFDYIDAATIPDLQTSSLHQHLPRSLRPDAFGSSLLLLFSISLNCNMKKFSLYKCLRSLSERRKREAYLWHFENAFDLCGMHDWWYFGDERGRELT
jgi:hypothetical protein